MTNHSAKSPWWILFFFLLEGGLCCAFLSIANAQVKVTDQLSLQSDFRFRYESDVADDKDENRDRARIRVRFGFLYNLSDQVEFGVRLRTQANSAQSPHQNLGELSSDSLTSGTANSTTPTQTISDDFGLDRAYINIKWLENGFLWLGKNQAAIWQQAENYWDADFQAEGAALGYTFRLREAETLTLQGMFSLLVEDDFIGVLEDRAIIPMQGIYERELDFGVLTIGAAAAPVIGALANTLPGGKNTYYLFGAQAELRNLPIPVLLGYEAYYGSNRSSPVGHQAVVRVRPWEKLEFRFFYDYIPVNSVPLQGAIVMDDSRFSSNYKGFQTGLWYTIMPGLQIDARVMFQSALDENLTIENTPGLGSWTQVRGDTTRFQTNLNIRF